MTPKQKETQKVTNEFIGERIQDLLTKRNLTHDSLAKILNIDRASLTRYILGQRNLPVTDTAYTDMVEIETLVAGSMIEALKSEITDKTNAKASFPSQEKVRYAITGDGPVLL